MQAKGFQFKSGCLHNKKFVMLFNSFSISHLLPLMVAILLFSSLVLLFIPKVNLKAIKLIGLSSSFFVFFLSLFLWIFFDKEYARFQFVYDFAWIQSSNLNLSLGIDGISIFLVILTTLLIPLCLLASWDSVKTAYKEYVIAFLIMEALLVLVFSVRDLLLFYICFESVLIPMFIIIGVWGSRERKVRAAYMFFYCNNVLLSSFYRFFCL